MRAFRKKIMFHWSVKDFIGSFLVWIQRLATVVSIVSFRFRAEWKLLIFIKQWIKRDAEMKYYVSGMYAFNLM